MCARIEFIASGAYQKMFETEAVMIAYATTGETPAYRETRRRTMCAWTQEVLAEQQMESWASVFRFCSVAYDDLYTAPLFQDPVWYRPDQPQPVPLFTH